MNDDLLQLCQSLKLRRIPKILDRELRRAEKQTPAYDEFLARLLREELHAFQERSDLTLVLSRDGGRRWQTLKILEKTPGKEYSYPFLLRSGDGYHLTYTFERARIKHVVFNEAWLKANKNYDN